MSCFVLDLSLNVHENGSLAGGLWLGMNSGNCPPVKRMSQEAGTGLEEGGGGVQLSVNQGFSIDSIGHRMSCFCSLLLAQPQL